ncbi:hypothetical protein FRB93_009832 [Tulasnella sp. JGI-2019a]|nr:hypothetical protein FRB93_009832 [Tulasnella sp. JGI-2019a]
MHCAILRSRLPLVYRIQPLALQRRGLAETTTISPVTNTSTNDPTASGEVAPEVTSQNIPSTFPNGHNDGYPLNTESNSSENNQSTEISKKPRGKRSKNSSLSAGDFKPKDDGAYAFIQKTVAQTLSLDDLLKLRPAMAYSPDVNAPRYRKMYETVRKKIDRSFTQRQLFQLLRKMGPGPLIEGTVTTAPAEKGEAIRRILNLHWDMPEPVEPESRKIITHDEPISSDQLFLLLGKDGSNLIKVAREYKVAIQPTSVESASLSLAIQGQQRSVQAVRSYFRQRLKAAQTFILEPLVPGAVGSDVAQTISRVSGAYFDINDPQKLRVTANDRNSYQAALRLTNRACFQKTASPLLIHTPASELDRSPAALYPYLSSEPLPWTLGRSSAFRVRRLGGWQKIDSESSNEEGGNPIPSQFGSFVSVDEKPFDLKDALLGPLPPLPQGHTRSVSAQTGHLVFPSTSSERTTFTPLVPGAHSTTDLMQRLTTSSEGLSSRVFVRSCPAPSDEQYEINNGTLTWRLKYRSRPRGLNHDTHPSHAISQKTLVAEYRPAIHAPGETFTSIELHCWIGDETRVDVAFPERPLDMSYYAFDHVAIGWSDIPQRLKGCASMIEKSGRMDASNLLPLKGLNSVVWNGTEFFLDRCESVQSQSPPESQSEGSRVTIMTEICDDLDSKVKTSCHVVTSTGLGSTSADSWTRFMHGCHEVSSRPYARPQARRNPFIRYTELDID